MLPLMALMMKTIALMVDTGGGGGDGACDGAGDGAGDGAAGVALMMLQLVFTSSSCYGINKKI